MITFIIFLLLFIKLGKGIRNETLLGLINLLLTLSLALPFFGETKGGLFASMFVTSPLIFFQKNILLLGTLLICMLNYEWLRKHPALPEFLMLLFSALLGMFFLISSGNLLIFYLSLELSTIPIAAMANFDLKKKISSEAATKMILSSAFSSGILLFGISLIYGLVGSLQFEVIPQLLTGTALDLIGFIFFFTAFAFKLSVVPFHLWTADVYEGSPIPVAAFLSVISKGAVAFILITVLYRVFQPLGEVTYLMLVIMTLATLIIGNLFALRQSNLKRFLAFSSISQIGFILVGISAGNILGIASVVFFILIYVFSNLGAFGVVSIVSEATGKETIQDYQGFYKNNKWLSWVMALSLFSLAGIPPLAGFFGKFFLILSGAGTKNAKVWFILIVALNMVVSLYYYLRIIRAIFMDQNSQPIAKINPGKEANFALAICLAGSLLVGLIGPIFEYILELSR